uniref:Uncharacterized protein n=1 Tax=Setaria digitata TaxID=48799 RepID=A0A915Q515_9BILA
MLASREEERQVKSRTSPSETQKAAAAESVTVRVWVWVRVGEKCHPSAVPRSTSVLCSCASTRGVAKKSVLKNGEWQWEMSNRGPDGKHTEGNS